MKTRFIWEKYWEQTVCTQKENEFSMYTKIERDTYLLTRFLQPIQQGEACLDNL